MCHSDGVPVAACCQGVGKKDLLFGLERRLDFPLQHREMNLYIRVFYLQYVLLTDLSKLASFIT